MEVLASDDVPTELEIEVADDIAEMSGSTELETANAELDNEIEEVGGSAEDVASEVLVNKERTLVDEDVGDGSTARVD